LPACRASPPPPRVEGVERRWPPPPRSRPPPMPRWRPGVVGGPSPLRALPSARLARFSRPNCAFDGRRFELAVRAELAQGREARTQCCSSLPLEPGFLQLSHKARAAPLCALDLRALRCAFAASCCVRTACACLRLRRPPTTSARSGAADAAPTAAFARSLRRLAPQTQQPPPQKQSSELLSALRGAPLERQRLLTASAPRLVCLRLAPSIR
jgi:hypothetical protein